MPIAREPSEYKRIVLCQQMFHDDHTTVTRRRSYDDDDHTTTPTSPPRHLATSLARFDAFVGSSMIIDRRVPWGLVPPVPVFIDCLPFICRRDDWCTDFIAGDTVGRFHSTSLVARLRISLLVHSCTRSRWVAHRVRPHQICNRRHPLESISVIERRIVRNMVLNFGSENITRR